MSTDVALLLVTGYQSASFTSMVAPAPATPFVGALAAFVGRRRRR